MIFTQYNFRNKETNIKIRIYRLDYMMTDDLFVF